jgi:hypothetical protein
MHMNLLTLLCTLGTVEISMLAGLYWLGRGTSQSSRIRR